MKFKANVYLGSLYQLVIVFLFFWLSRLIFIFYNAPFIDVTSFGDVVKVCMGGLVIDSCIFSYFNVLFILMRFAPWPWAYNQIWIAVSNWLLGIVGTLFLLLNFGDTVYFPFTGYRMSWQSFMNVLTDPGTPGLLLLYLSRYWWAYIAGLLSIIAMIWLMLRVRFVKTTFFSGPRSVYWAGKSLVFVLAGGFTFICMRGWTGFKDRPIERATGVKLVDRIQQFPAVLNTPFSIIFSRKGDVLIEKKEIYTADELKARRQSVVYRPGQVMNGKNIFILVIESGGAIHSRIFNPVSGDSTYNRAMPFVDSLATHSLINPYMIASGRTSAQGITHIFTGMPFFGSSYLVESPYVENVFDSPARLLNQEGYDTRFYYGCAKGNYHIDETAQLSGFQTIRTRESYNNDKDFDSKWGIWDKKMADYVVRDMSEAYSPDKPFLASWFTITAHDSNNFPNDEDVSDYSYPKSSPERAMEYTDRSIRHFFELARRQPWYDNTIFIITSDHGQREYSSFHTKNLFTYSHLPFIIYTPDGSIQPGVVSDMPMSQIDIAPTVLDLAGYNKPFVSFGTSMFDSGRPHFGLAESFGQYYVFGDKYMVGMPGAGTAVNEVYDINEKPYPHTPLKTYDVAVTDSMAGWLNALMQDFTTRINDDNLTIQNQKKP